VSGTGVRKHSDLEPDCWVAKRDGGLLSAVMPAWRGYVNLRYVRSNETLDRGFLGLVDGHVSNSAPSTKLVASTFALDVR